MIIGSGVTVGPGIAMTSDIVAPTFISSGLVLNLDAGNPASYPGTGTTWTDTSGSGYTGTLGTGVTYSSSKGGVLTFSGATTALVTMTASGLASLTNNFTVESWYQSTNNYPEIIANGSGGSGFVFGYFSGHSTNWKVTKYGVIDIYTGSIPQDTNWHHVVLTYSSTGGTTVYVDGAVNGTNASTASLSPGGTFYIGRGESTSYMHNGSIGIVRFYNTAFTLSQVSQNFNALRSRYGV
jgi:Concanavalin A-like lectin/glucanases superfamily